MPQPTPFNPTGALPLVGQMVKPITWFPTVLVECFCQHPSTPILIVTQAPQSCPNCKRVYVVSAISWELGKPPSITLGTIRSSEPVGENIVTP